MYRYVYIYICVVKSVLVEQDMIGLTSSRDMIEMNSKVVKELGPEDLHCWLDALLQRGQHLRQCSDKLLAEEVVRRSGVTSYHGQKITPSFVNCFRKYVCV